MSILHAYTATASSVSATYLVHPDDWTAAHSVAAETVLNGFAPIGSVSPYAGPISGIPAGWLFCNGASLLRAGTYATLFTAISTIYGAADGTHFNLPDLRDRFVVSAYQDDTVPKTSIRGSLEQSATIPAATLTHNGSVADHTLTHAGLSVAAHTMTHTIEIADHPSMSLTISIANQGTAGRTGTKTASAAVTSSAHAWTNPTAAARTHTITQPDHTVTHGVTQPNAHGTAGAVSHSFTAPTQHTMTPVPAFLALAYMIRYC